MSIVKSLSVGNGDMYYIRHNSPCLTMIDCCMGDDRKGEILAELGKLHDEVEIVRFISTHPDKDHITGLDNLHNFKPIINFYCVENKISKYANQDDDFDRYYWLRDRDKPKANFLFRGLQKKWLNEKSDERGQSGISILWPVRESSIFKEALKLAHETDMPNNISPIIKYNCEDISFVWMGDLESKFADEIIKEIDLGETTVLFAPHHGRGSAKLSQKVLDKLNPKIVVIGEAPHQHLNYYQNHNTITQNTAEDIVFEVSNRTLDVFVSSPGYPNQNYLSAKNGKKLNSRFAGRGFYLGSL